MGRTPSSSADGLKKGAWTAEENQKLIAYIQKHGEGNWRSLPEKAGLQRCGKSCRLRWANYLRPGIKRGDFTPEEEQTIIQLHATLGNRWAAIARHLQKRTDNEIKNYWHAHLKKRLATMGVDSVTHTPMEMDTSTASSSNGDTSNTSSSANPSKLDDDKPAETARYEEGSSSSRSRSVSTSAMLLNKLATNITALRCTSTLRAFAVSRNDHGVKDIAVANDSINATASFSSNTSTVLPAPTAASPNWLVDDMATAPSPLAVESINLENIDSLGGLGSRSSSTTPVGMKNNMDATFAALYCSGIEDWHTSSACTLPDQSGQIGAPMGDIDVSDIEMCSISHIGPP